MPSYVPAGLQEAYAKAEMSPEEFYLELKKIAAMKMIDVDVQFIKLVYVELLSKGFKKKSQFLRALERVKLSQVYGRLDIAMFLQGETCIKEAEVNETIKEIIRKGEIYKTMLERGYKLTEEEEKAVEVYVATRVEFELRRQRAELIERLTEERANEKMRRIRQQALEELDSLSPEEMDSLVNELAKKINLKAEVVRKEIRTIYPLYKGEKE